MQQKLDEYRRRFRDAPVGAWATSQGTFDAAMSDTILFAADRTGTINYRSEFAGDSMANFEWREKSPQVIEVRYADDADDDEEPWEEIAYDFKLLEHDAGNELVMHEVGQEGFWDFLAPLRRVG